MGDCKSCESNKPNVRQYDIDLLSAMAERTIKRLLKGCSNFILIGNRIKILL